MLNPKARPCDQAAIRSTAAAGGCSENANKGVVQIDGRMVERLHADIARRTVAVADAIAAQAKETSVSA